MNECPFCRNPVQSHWNFCRRCGARLEQETEDEKIEELVKEDPSSPTGVIYEPLQEKIEEPEEEKEEPEEEKKELTDDELVARISDVILKRKEYNELLKRKKEVNTEISKLLDRLQNKLIPRGEALPRIKELKKEVTTIKEKEKDFDDFEAILPIEEIIEDRNMERLKLEKLNTLKRDKSVSRATFTEMETKYEKSVNRLEEKLNLELVKMRKTFDALERKLKKLQKKLEVLYVQYQTGELSETEYQKEKEEKSSKIKKMKEVSRTVANILAEAK